jgi:ATP/ADP translocase
MAALRIVTLPAASHMFLNPESKLTKYPAADETKEDASFCF